ncbi:hypothetical protein PENSPDRAFT_592161 [Peniophora sp. CONT]|nr:hypothetical protein PENSPDRAFT_592161 [Peniophora sp. CONT]
MADPASRESWNRPSRFKEHLSLASVYDDYTEPQPEPLPIEVSHFSPDTPHTRGAHHLDDIELKQTHAPVPPHAVEPPPAPYSYRPRPSTLSIFSGSTAYRAFSPPTKYRDLEHGHSKDQEYNEHPAPTPRSATTFRDRMSKRFFEFRFGGRRNTASLFELPIQQPMPPPWEPLNIHKKNMDSQATAVCTCHAHGHKHKHKDEGTLSKWRKRFLIVVLVVILLWLMGNVVALDTRVFPLGQPATSASADAPSAWSTLTPEEQSCLTQYTLNAPSNPTLYPCAQCLPRVSSIKVNDSSIAQTAADATMFCGVRSLWEDADATGQAALQAVGWVQDVKFCAWGGVQCNGSGQVSSIQLVTPAVPAGIPSQINSLSALETFSIIGNTSIPAGPLPASFSSLNLTTLHLESTALQGSLPDSLGRLTTLTLVRNPQLEAALPDSVAQGSLTSLIVNNQNLSFDSTQQAAFCSGSALQTCDLRGTGVVSCGSCTVG